MAAEIVARELGLDLYRIDLAGVVSKWIGETEKNLDRIFSAAENATRSSSSTRRTRSSGSARRSRTRTTATRTSRSRTCSRRWRSTRASAILATNRMRQPGRGIPPPHSHSSSASRFPRPRTAYGSGRRSGRRARRSPTTSTCTRLAREHSLQRSGDQERRSRGGVPGRRGGRAGDDGRAPPRRQARVREIWERLSRQHS